MLIGEVSLEFKIYIYVRPTELKIKEALHIHTDDTGQQV